MINAHPKIFAIGQRYIQNIFEDSVFVEEKVDGSQFSFAKIDGEMIYRSKGKRQMAECPDKLFKNGITYLESIKDIIPENIQFYCEYLSKPKHNTLAYERTPKNYLVLFGAYHIDSDKFYYARSILERYADILNIDIIPTLYYGKIESIEQLKEFLKKDSYLGNSKIEGVVIKNYNKDILLGGHIIPIMCGKYVSEEFKEVHTRNWKKDKTGKGRWETFQEQYQTEARWLKAVQYLRDSGELEQSPKDIGKLMKRVNLDIIEECKEEICEFLWKEFSKELLRKATKGLPEWYKDQLVKESFRND